MRRAQLLSLLMILALAAVLVTVLVTTTRQPPDDSQQTPAEPTDEATTVGQASAPAADGNGSGSNAQAPEPSPELNGEGDELSSRTIRRIALNGQDLADLLELSMWKYRFRIPENEYTLYLWVERWTRNAPEPEIRELLTLSGVWADSEMVLKLPTEEDQRLFFRIGDAISRSSEISPLQTPSSWRREALQQATLSPDRDVYLLTYTYNELETATGGRVNVHRQNDVTVYVKMRFTPGPFVPFDAERIISQSY